MSDDTETICYLGMWMHVCKPEVDTDVLAGDTMRIG